MASKSFLSRVAQALTRGDTNGQVNPTTEPSTTSNLPVSVSACKCKSAPLLGTSQTNQSVSCPIPGAASQTVFTIPLPGEDTYTYVTVKGSLHDSSCVVFGLNRAEELALSTRFENVDEVVNGVFVEAPPMELINALAELNYKVVCSCGEAEISWTMQREV